MGWSIRVVPDSLDVTQPFLAIATRERGPGIPPERMRCRGETPGQAYERIVRMTKMETERIEE